MKYLIILLATFSLNNAIKAQEKSTVKVQCDKKKSTITYAMNHPLHAWTADCNEVNGIILTDKDKNTIGQVAVMVKVSSFDSKNANRDSHTIEVVEGLKYPVISFKSTNIKQDGDKLTVTGTLKFHNVSKLISFEATKTNNKDKIKVEGGFSIKMTEFNIEPPSLMGMATDDEIKITFDLLF